MRLAHLGVACLTRFEYAERKALCFSGLAIFQALIFAATLAGLAALHVFDLIYALPGLRVFQDLVYSINFCLFAK